MRFLRGLPVHCRRGGDGALPLVVRCTQQARLLLATGVTADDYYRYRLERPGLPWERKREFVGSMDPWRWLGAFNPLTHRVFTEDKRIFKRYLAALGVPVPRLLGVTGPHGMAESGEFLRTDDEVASWLRARRIQHAVLKPVMGSRGTGVLVLGAMTGPDEWERVPDGRISSAEVAAHLRRFPHRPIFLVEERLWPHPTLAAFSPQHAHTARVLTIVHEGVPEILAAALRIAAGTSAVDNFSQGNLAAPIDLETGRLGAAAFSKAAGGVRVDTHPVTGARITGLTVPDWDAARQVLGVAARAVPFNALLGWDVAFTDRGPVILEANDLWDADVTQIAPDRGVLGTRLSEHLRASKVQRLLVSRIPPPARRATP